jgi:hypothetical protein
MNKCFLSALCFGAGFIQAQFQLCRNSLYECCWCLIVITLLSLGTKASDACVYIYMQVKNLFVKF